jgi:poly(3-hydroxybutyrate) depolymerase
LIEDSLADRVFDTGLSNGGGRQEREAGEDSYD